MVDLPAIRARLAAHDGARCGAHYRYEFEDDADRCEDEGPCTWPEGHTGDHGPMQPEDREAEIVAWLRSQLTTLPWSVAAGMIERGEGR